ncbi:MAG TPA: LysR substrate-binding domain-containing protein, partial [Dehalococcoidia bacterium]|nr:LysR substrate-binding domain-containing protein [Dehalococcoidia bacterium]
MLPKVALDRELKDGSLREIAIADMPNPTRQIALISRRSRPLGPVAQAFVDIVTEIFSSDQTPTPVAAAG